MPQRDRLRLTNNASLLFLVVFIPSIAHADAILPSLALIWPITILLLIPIVLIEALYSRKRLKLGFWESIRVLGVANVLSTIAGLPIANLFAAGLQYILESAYFHDPSKIFNPMGGELRAHDHIQLIFLGVYPRWILLVSAAVMVGVCFVISWWIEAKWVSRYIGRQKGATSDGHSCSQVLRNANVLSYLFVMIFSLWALVTLWSPGVAGGIPH